MEILHEDDIRGLVEISATRSAGSFEWSLENKAKGLKLLIWGHGSDIIGESIAEALEKEISIDHRDIEAVFNLTMTHEDGTILYFEFDYPQPGGYRFTQEGKTAFDDLKHVYENTYREIVYDFLDKAIAQYDQNIQAIPSILEYDKLDKELAQKDSTSKEKKQKI